MLWHDLPSQLSAGRSSISTLLLNDFSRAPHNWITRMSNKYCLYLDWSLQTHPPNLIQIHLNWFCRSWWRTETTAVYSCWRLVPIFIHCTIKQLKTLWPLFHLLLHLWSWGLGCMSPLLPPAPSLVQCGSRSSKTAWIIPPNPCIAHPFAATPANR